MTQHQPNLSSVAPAALPSLATIRQGVLTDQRLPEKRRRDMASALTSLAKALGLQIELIPADPAILRGLLKGCTPAMAGKAAGRWQNILSLTSAALSHAGIVQLEKRFVNEPSPAWLILLDVDCPAKLSRFYLARFARYCTRIGVEPDTVTDETVATYQNDLVCRSLVNDPKRSAREVARRWNAIAHLAPKPLQPLTVPDNRRVFTPEWDAYPQTLRSDVEAFLSWLSNDDPFGDCPSAGLRPASILTRRRQLRLLVGALTKRDIPLSRLVDLKAVVTVEHAKIALGFFWEKAGKKPSSHVYQLSTLVLLLARHWVRLESVDITRLKVMADRLRPTHVGISDRNIIRLQQLQDKERFEALCGLPKQLASLAQHMGSPCPKSARLMQTAAAVAISLALPLRIENLRSLRIGRELTRGLHGTMAIAQPGANVKNGQRLDAPLPREAAKLIAVYIDRYRPLLATAGGDFLFPGISSVAPKCAVALRGQMTKTIADRCGLAWHPHLFRHFAAWVILCDNPGAHGMVQRVLGQRSLHATMASYSGLETAAAIERYDQLLSGPDKLKPDNKGSRS